MSELSRVVWTAVQVDSPVQINIGPPAENAGKVPVHSNEDDGVGRDEEAQLTHTNEEGALEEICVDSDEEVDVERRAIVAQTESGESEIIQSLDSGEYAGEEGAPSAADDCVEPYLDSGDDDDDDDNLGNEDNNSSPDSAYDSNSLSEQEQPKGVEQVKPNAVVSVEIPEGKDDDESTAPCKVHLHTYFKFLYAIGVSAYGGRENERVGIKNRIVATLQMIGFVLVSVLAFIRALENLKYYCLQFALDGSLVYYVYIGRFAFDCLSAVYFVKFAAFDSKKITNLLDKLPGKDENRNSHQQKIPVSALALVLGTTSMILAFMTTLFSSFTVKNVLAGDPFLQRSWDISYTIFVWSTKNESQRVEELDAEYGREFTFASVVFGSVGSLMEFGGSLQNMAIRDLMLLAALALHQHVVEFSATFQNVSLGEQFKKFSYLQDISKVMASALGTLLTILHVKNMLLLTDFLLKLLKRSNYKMALVFMAIDLVKMFVTYITAAKASRINQNFRAWIHEQHRKQDSTQGQGFGVDAKGATMLLYLDDLKGEPVGLGSGISFVSVSFFAKFAGYVISCFLFFANNSSNKCG